MSTVMIGDGLTSNRPINSMPSVNRSQRDIPKAQQTIYEHLLEIVKTWAPDDVLEEFKHLFVHHVNTASSAILPALYEIVFANNEVEFKNTLKRSCYILINNWDISRNHDSIRKLIKLFSDPILHRHTQSPTLRRLRAWLKNFINSKDFEELCLFTAKYDDLETVHWSQRYASYLLVPQYINLENSVEQREAARALSRELKERFKLDLAFYTALSESVRVNQKAVKNPTFLGDESLRLIKKIVARRGTFSYANLANIFLKQTQNLNYGSFKKSLKEYLIYSLGQNEFVQKLEKQLEAKLDSLYEIHEEKEINDALLLRTSNRVVEYLTSEDHESPSALFLMLMSQGNALTLVIVLLKIVLICRHVRTHLEARIADLIRYYEKYPEEDCKWVVSFFEIFNITMTIYAENTEYTLVSMANLPQTVSANQDVQRSLNEFRIFSQIRLLGELDEAEADGLNFEEIGFIEDDDMISGDPPHHADHGSA